MSTQNVDLLSRLLLPVLILLVVGIVVIAVWLIWAATRSRGDTNVRVRANAGPEDAGSRRATGESDRTADFLSIRRRARGEWEIHVEGRPYTTLEAVPNLQKRAEILSAFGALAAFTGDQHPSPLSPGEQVLANAERARLPIAARAAPSPGRRGAPDTALPTIDLAREIQEILDEMLARHPSLQGHAVTLQNRPGYGIAFVVDGAIHQEIADIPNPEIRTLIRDATKEWERR
jgi:hypothetical protein